MLVFLAAALQSTVVCPVMGVDLVDGVGRYDYGGVRLGFCCMACRNAFETDPAAVVESAQEKKRLYGEFLFDLATRKRIDPAKAEAHFDQNGIRFYTAKREALPPGSKRPKLTLPKQESLFCLSKGMERESYAKALAFGDLEGVRFYLDCAECEARFAKDPKSFAAEVKEHIRPVTPFEVPKDPSP